MVRDIFKNTKPKIFLSLKSKFLTIAGCISQNKLDEVLSIKVIDPDLPDDNVCCMSLTKDFFLIPSSTKVLAASLLISKTSISLPV